MLQLNLDYPSTPEARSPVNVYTLKLSGGYGAQAEREANDRRLKEIEDKGRMVNPTPRF